MAEHRNPHSGRDRQPPHGQVGELSKHFAHDAVLGQLEGVVGDEGEDVAAYMAGQGLQRAEPAVLRVRVVVVVDGSTTVIVVQHVLRVVAVVGLQRREGRRVARGLGRALGLAAPPSRRGWHRRAAAPSRAAADLARRSALCCGPGSLPRRLCRGGGAAARHAARLRHARPWRAGHRRGPARPLSRPRRPASRPCRSAALSQQSLACWHRIQFSWSAWRFASWLKDSRPLAIGTKSTAGKVACTVVSS